MKEHSEEVESITGTFARVEKARAASIVNKSVIMDHVCSENHVIGWGSVKVSDKELGLSVRKFQADNFWKFKNKFQEIFLSVKALHCESEKSKTPNSCP